MQITLNVAFLTYSTRTVTFIDSKPRKKLTWSSPVEIFGLIKREALAAPRRGDVDMMREH